MIRHFFRVFFSGRRVMPRAEVPLCRQCRSPFREFWEVLEAAPSTALRQAESLCPDCVRKS